VFRTVSNEESSISLPDPTVIVLCIAEIAVAESVSAAEVSWYSRGLMTVIATAESVSATEASW